MPLVLEKLFIEYVHVNTNRNLSAFERFLTSEQRKAPFNFAHVVDKFRMIQFKLTREYFIVFDVSLIESLPVAFLTSKYLLTI